MLSIVLPILVRQESDDLTQIQKVYALSATRNAVVRIDLGDATATATTTVGEARSHAPIAFFRDQWRKTDVAGTVTLGLLDVPTEEALQAIVRQAHATYRVEGGVFQMVRIETPPATKPT